MVVGEWAGVGVGWWGGIPTVVGACMNSKKTKFFKNLSYRGIQNA